MSIGKQSTPGLAGLGILFGAFYFIQGIGEPTEGLIAQPVRALLRDWDRDTEQIGWFLGWLALPWSLKPLYGVLTDFVPLAGSRRRGYLLLFSGAAALGLALLSLFPPARGAVAWLFLLLFLPTLGVAFCDVVIDALMIEAGKPRGLTGQLQSIQWAAIYGATILTGSLGGYLSAHNRQDVGFWICGGMALASFGLAWFCVRDNAADRRSAGFAEAWASVRRAVRNPGLWLVALFLWLFTFNPFTSAVLQEHMNSRLGLGEQFYGHMISVSALTSLLASAAYGLYCRRVPFPWLLHGSIAAGVASTVGYWLVGDAWSALAVTVFTSFAYMTALLVQLDFAARVCEADSAGTSFALLMAISNSALSASYIVGGSLHKRLGEAVGPDAAFFLLVGIGAGCTAACWLLTPALSALHDLRSAGAPLAAETAHAGPGAPECKS